MSKYVFIIVFYYLCSTNAASIYVISPTKLANQFQKFGEISSTLGNYGHHDYGSVAIGKLNYP